MNKPTQVDLAWAAGFIDGEGCIGIRKEKPPSKRPHISLSYRLWLEVTNTKLEPIIRLQTLFAGNIVTRSSKGKRLQHKWLLSGKRAKECLRLILPYLSCKYEQAHLAIEFQRTIKQRGNRLTSDQLQFRELFYQKMRILNAKGIKALDTGKQAQIEEFVKEIQNRAQKQMELW